MGQYKNYNENYDRRLDTALDEVAQYKIIKKLQDELPATDILRGDPVKDIISVISSAKGYGLSSTEMAEIARVNQEDSKVLSEVISPLLQNVVPRVYRESYENAYLPIYQVLEKYADAAPIMPRIERNIASLARDLKTAMTEAEAAEKIKPLSDWKDTYFEKDAGGNYRLKDRIANLKLASIAKIMAAYEAYLKEAGAFDFDDMIQEAVKALSTDEGFRLTLTERYQFIMLDEFQDTNPAQLSVVKCLTQYEKPMIMAVGDDDQAIYEFQGALASNLTDFQEYYGAEVIPLTENYRSTQEILDFSREIIKQAPDRFGDKILTAHQPAPESTQIRRVEFRSADAEYGFIAEEIVKLIRAGVPQSDIAVLSYKTKYFMPLLKYLKAYPEINIAYEKRDNLFEDEKIHEILSLAEYIYDIASENKPSVSIMEILAYPFFELPMLEVIREVGRAKQAHQPVFEVLSQSENLKIAETFELLSLLVAKSITEPLEVFLDKLIGLSPIDDRHRSPFISYYSKNSQNDYEVFTLYENLASLRGKIRKHFGEKPLKLKDLIEMVQDYTAADMPLNTTSPYRDAEDAVQILSAHKAKGLEFKYVFIISADHTAWGKGKGNNNLLALPKNLMQIRHTGTTDGEKLRILYVALTRAKYGLIITNSLHDFAGKEPTRLEYFDEYVEGDDVISPYLPARKVETHYDFVPGKQAEDNLKNWFSPYFAKTPDMRAIYKERLATFRMSASALTTFIDVVYGGPESFFKTYVLQVPMETEPEALAYGDLIHHTFEAVTKQNLSQAEAVEYYLADLAKKDLSPEVMRNVREEGPANLAVALGKFEGILREGQAEVDFSPERLVVNGIPVTGKIDHLTINEAEKTIEIYDFKTGPYHKEKWDKHPTLYKYMLQLCFYKMLLTHSREYTKYRVNKAHILFVTPDKDGEVYDKVYDFTPEDEKLCQDLMRAVYDSVISLDFMDDPEIFMGPDGTLGLKDIKEFVALMLAKNEAK